MGVTDWWKRLWSKPDERAPAIERETSVPEAMNPEAPAQKAQLIEFSAELSVQEYRHAINTADGALQLRTFVSRGLSNLGAAELRFTLPADWGNEIVSWAISFLGELLRLTKEGRPAELGGFTGLRSSIFGSGLIGFIYARATPLLGIDEGQLALVLLNEEELNLVMEGNATRILGRLAERARFFPYPPWWELRAEPVLSRHAQQESILLKIPVRVGPRDSRVTRIDDKRIVVSLGPQAPQMFRRMWEQGAIVDVFALVAMLAPDADAQMVWIPGADAPCATSAGDRPPRKFGHSFAAFLRQSEESDRYRMIEDGLGIFLENGSFERLRDALCAGTPLIVHLADGATLEVQFRPKEGWEIYEPDGGKRPQTGRLETTMITLLLADSLLASRVEVEVLAGVMQQIEHLIENLAAKYTVRSTVDVSLAITLRPNNPCEAEISWRHGDASALHQPLYEALIAMPPVDVRDDVPFQIDAKIHPYPRGN